MLPALRRASRSSSGFECDPFFFYLSLRLPDLPTRYITIGRSRSTIKFHAEHLKISFFVFFCFKPIPFCLLFSFLCFSVYYYPSTFSSVSYHFGMFRSGLDFFAIAAFVNFFAFTTTSKPPYTTCKSLYKYMLIQ